MRRFTTGWELSTTLTDMHDNTTSGSNYNVEVSTTSPRSGSNKFRAYRTAGFSGTTGCYVTTNFGESTSRVTQQETGTTRSSLINFDNIGETFYFRFFFNIATMPTGSHAIDIIRFISSGTPVFAIQINASAIKQRDASGAVTTVASGGFSTGTWYRAIGFVRVKAGSKWKYCVTIMAETTDTVIGSSFQEDTGTAASADQVLSVRFGIMPIALAGTANMDIAFDDLAINDERDGIQDDIPIYGAVNGVSKPSGAGGATEFDNTGDGTNWHAVDDWNDILDFNRTPAAAAVKEDRYDHESFATAGGTGNITSVMLWATWADEPGEDGGNHKIGIYDSGGKYCCAHTNPEITAGDTQVFHGIPLTGYGFDGVSATGTLTAWTNSEFDNAGNEFFVKHFQATANQRLRLYSIRAEVECDGGLTLTNPYKFIGQGGEE